MRSLIQLIQDAPLYRRGGQDVALGRRPVVVYTTPAELPEAVRVFRDQFGVKPFRICIYGAQTDDAYGGDVPQIDAQELALHQDLLVWAYGKGERSLGIKLAQLGVRDFVFALDPPYKDVRYQPKLLSDHRDELETLFATLADEESKLTLASIIKQRLRGEHGFLRIASYSEYSHPLVRALPGDCVVDAGAFDGRTSLSFARQAAGGRVLAFEPDPSNLERIKKSLLKAKGGENKKNVAAASIVEIAPYALFSAETTLRFSANKSGSSAITTKASETIEVPAISLDVYVDRYDVDQVDLVSVDVEGAEEEVLRGMSTTIERHRPKLQISIYHRRHDLFTLPALVRTLCKDYLYFLGHHNTYSTETDLYAIPRERVR